MKITASLLIISSLTLQLNGHSLVKRQEGGGAALPPREVAPGVYSFLTGFAVSMFIITDDGVMVIDPMNFPHAEKMLAEIRKITDAPIRYLFYSHNHYDHAKGGQVFKDEGATIVSHIDAYKYIEANPSQDLVLPDQYWTGDKTEIILGDKTLELHSAGPSHGNGMTTFVLPRERVMFNQYGVKSWK